MNDLMGMRLSRFTNSPEERKAELRVRKLLQRAIDLTRDETIPDRFKPIVEEMARVGLAGYLGVLEEEKADREAKRRNRPAPIPLDERRRKDES